ncbi:WecB/TagA/CpsF family glycosyltransferase [Poseidonibacter antarcticus]|uniref:WecB/TagA/CpsF family glycosyltransferase n=1 Tax=Poseidonibacter antarcticus TaxID=2478538 RepID=UPI000EF4A6B9|nr:WecB/TagA/CpsF family glycosyltransferase [Poseidonibacter antarcticus]
MKTIYKKIDDKFNTKKEFTQLLETESSDIKLVTFLNPFSYTVYLENPNLVDEFDVFFADGALLVKLHNIFNSKKIDRVSFDFSSIAKDVLDFANTKSMNIAFIGAKQDELNGAIKNIKTMYSNINIVYHRNGYFNSEEDYEICFDELSSLTVDMLVIGMGSPYQEKFAVRVKNAGLKIPLIFTCGGFFTQTSIKADYYHPLVKKFGLRWLQRAIMHKHVRNRLLKDYPSFLIKYIYNHIIYK